jgi:hypothetical protein
MSPRTLTLGSAKQHRLGGALQCILLLQFAISIGQCQGVAANDVLANDGLGTKGEARILRIIPNYQTVSDPDRAVPPLTGREKWALFARGTTDPFNVVNAVIGGTLSQMRLGIPNYGPGRGAYGERVGAALADMTTQSMFSGAVLATLMHQDPRYFRRGPRSGVLTRVAYAVSRVAVTRQDSGKAAPNWSFLLGTGLGIGLSNAYYPDHSRTSSIMLPRIGSSIVGSAMGNLLPEFWPDIQHFQHRLFHRRF